MFLLSCFFQSKLRKERINRVKLCSERIKGDWHSLTFHDTFPDAPDPEVLVDTMGKSILEHNKTLPPPPPLHLTLQTKLWTGKTNSWGNNYEVALKSSKFYWNSVSCYYWLCWKAFNYVPDSQTESWSPQFWIQQLLKLRFLFTSQAGTLVVVPGRVKVVLLCWKVWQKQFITYVSLNQLPAGTPS